MSGFFTTPLVAVPPARPSWSAVLFVALLASGCATADRPAPRGAPATPTPIPTAVIYADPASRRPVWPTPPVWCRVGDVGAERADLGPSMGQFPIWLVSRPLPVLPWRNQLVRTVWVVDRSVEGDLVLTGRQIDGPGLVRFIREGSERASEQLVIASAPRVGPTTGSPTASQYADLQVSMLIPQPGCYELHARLAEHRPTFVVYLYN